MLMTCIYVCCWEYKWSHRCESYTTGEQ